VGAVLARHGWLVAIAAIYLYVFPYFPAIQSANELPRVYLVRSIVDAHTFALDAPAKVWGQTGDMSPSGGHVYSNKAPGSSLLVVPAYAAARVVGDPGLAGTMWLCRVVGGIVPALLFLVLLSRFLARFSPDEATRRLVLVAYALGSMAMTYAILFYSHQLSAICIASAWIVAVDVVDGKRGARAMLAAGALAGAAPLVDYQAALAGVPVFAWLVATLWQRRGDRPGELARVLGCGAAGAVLPIALLLAYHTVCFGGPLHTGYAASEVYAADHAHGLLGATYPKWTAVVGTTVAVDKGLFALAPWLVLTIPGTVVLWRRGERGTAIVGGAVFVLFLAFVASLAFWRAGWEVGPRYVTAMLPFTLPAVVALVDAVRASAHPRAKLVAGAVAAPMLVAIAIYTLSSATFPYWPDAFHDPLYEVTFRLLGDNLVAPSLGSALGLAGVVGIAPYLVACAAVAGWAIARVAGPLGLAVAGAIAAAWLGAYGLVTHGGTAADAAYQRTVKPAVEKAQM
jgi:hypothetical protein